LARLIVTLTAEDRIDLLLVVAGAKVDAKNLAMGAVRSTATAVDDGSGPGP